MAWELRSYGLGASDLSGQMPALNEELAKEGWEPMQVIFQPEYQQQGLGNTIHDARYVVWLKREV